MGFFCPGHIAVDDVGFFCPMHQIAQSGNNLYVSFELFQNSSIWNFLRLIKKGQRSYFETAQTCNMSRLSYFKNSSKWRKFTQIYSKILQVLISISSYFNKAQTSNMSRLSYFKNSSKWREFTQRFYKF